MEAYLSTEGPDTSLDWRFLLAQAVWMAVSLAALYLTDQLSFEPFFVLSFVGLLIVTHVFEPASRTQRRVVYWLIYACLVVFAVITAQRVISLVG